MLNPFTSGEGCSRIFQLMSAIALFLGRGPGFRILDNFLLFLNVPNKKYNFLLLHIMILALKATPRHGNSGGSEDPSSKKIYELAENICQIYHALL